jgi:hypothetical protein
MHPAPAALPACRPRLSLALRACATIPPQPLLHLKQRIVYSACNRYRHGPRVSDPVDCSLVRPPLPSSCGRSSLMLLCRDYCSSDIRDDKGRQVVLVELCPIEMDNEEAVVAELS